MSQNIEKNKNIELSTFYVGDALCGLDILKIQEINKIMERTPVPQAPAYVLGVLNLRGQIVTIIDLGRKLGLGTTEITDDTRNIIVRSSDGATGFLVRNISEVVEMDQSEIEKAPANMKGIQGKYFSGVFKTKTSIIGVLDAEEVLAFTEGEGDR